MNTRSKTRKEAEKIRAQKVSEEAEASSSSKLSKPTVEPENEESEASSNPSNPPDLPNPTVDVAPESEETQLIFKKFREHLQKQDEEMAAMDAAIAARTSRYEEMQQTINRVEELKQQNLELNKKVDEVFYQISTLSDTQEKLMEENLSLKKKLNSAKQSSHEVSLNLQTTMREQLDLSKRSANAPTVKKDLQKRLAEKTEQNKKLEAEAAAKRVENRELSKEVGDLKGEVQHWLPLVDGLKVMWDHHKRLAVKSQAGLTGFLETVVEPTLRKLENQQEDHDHEQPNEN